MVDVLGYDIGGANTKAAFVTVERSKIQQVKIAAKYFPVWKEPDKLTGILEALKSQLGVDKLNALGVTMTAELSDAYRTKREGVNHILSCVKKAFPDVQVYVLNTDSKMQSVDASTNEPLSVASANWAATGWLVAQHTRNAVVVDVGSTSTSIIPIIDGKVAASGKTDLDKLINGELVYTGSLRTNAAAIVQSIPLRGVFAAVSSELFALSGDVHLTLGNISSEDYSSETSDGRGKTMSEAMARLTRVVCADPEMLSKQEIIDIARYIYEKQIDQIEEGLRKVYALTKSLTSQKLPVIVTGLGRDFLARRAAQEIGVDSIVNLDALLQSEAVFATPAFGVALMAACEIEGVAAK